MAIWRDGAHPVTTVLLHKHNSFSENCRKIQLNARDATRKLKVDKPRNKDKSS